MADLGPGFTRTERRLAHALGFMLVSRMSDDRMDMVVAEMRQMVQGLKRRKESAALVDAAEAMCSAWPRRNGRGDGAMAWVVACLDADRAVQGFHWAAICALQGADHVS